MQPNPAMPSIPIRTPLFTGQYHVYTRREIGGRMTLLAHRPTVIDATRGAVFAVEYGTVEVRFDDEPATQTVRAGGAFCTVTEATVTLHCVRPARLRIDWPAETPATVRAECRHRAFDAGHRPRLSALMPSPDGTAPRVAA